MKKINAPYFFLLVVFPACLLLAFFIFSVIDPFEMKINSSIFAVAALALFLISTKVSSSRFKKCVHQLEDTFEERKFDYQQRFIARTAVFYIDVNGRMAVICKWNPSELQFVNMNKVTDIKSNDGKMFNGGTSRVCCEFRLDGKKYRIITLTVRRGSLRMTDSVVLEAISKADRMCEMLTIAKQEAAM